MIPVSWLAFGLSSTVTKTFMHFLPAAAGIGAPYQVDLKVTVGGSSLPRRTFTVDGARLGHPDGFRLEEAVPALNQQVSGLYLLQVDLAPSQQRIDLGNSCVLIEVQYQQGAVRYLPRRICTQNEASLLTNKKENNSENTTPLGSIMARGVFNPEAKNSTGFALRDPSLFASLVVLNSSPQNILARVVSSRNLEAVGTVNISADSVKEFELSELGLSRATKLDSTWGSLEVEAFSISFEQEVVSETAQEPESTGQKLFQSEPILGAAAAAYLVYRERNSRRISSVIAL